MIAEHAFPKIGAGSSMSPLSAISSIQPVSKTAISTIKSKVRP